MEPKRKRRAVRPSVEGSTETTRPESSRREHRYRHLTDAATCLSRVLARHGLDAPLSEICKHLSAYPTDNNIINFLDVAERLGLEGRPVVLTVEEWSTIPVGSILHWGPDHLVVFESFDRDEVRIHDPAQGDRIVDHEEFRRLFTGVVLLFAPLRPQES